jgi:4-amino-4-deoxychorismate lyase
MYRFFETIRITGGSPQFLPWHESRLNRTRQAFWKELPPIELKNVIDPPAAGISDVIRCRVIYGREIESIEYTTYFRKSICSLRMVDGNKTDYNHKSLDRERLEELMEQRGGCDDILIVKNGRITDSFAANVIFFDGNRWVTPQQPLLPGTCRARLLKEGLLTEKSIGADELDHYTGIKLINALRYPDESEMIPVGQVEKMAIFAKKKR